MATRDRSSRGSASAAGAGARRPGRRAPAWPGRGAPPAPRPSPAPACPGRRSRRRRSPGRRTTARSGTAPVPPAPAGRGGRRRGRAAPGAGRRRRRRGGAGRRWPAARSPPGSSVTFGRTSGVSASDGDLGAADDGGAGAVVAEPGRAHDDGVAAHGGAVHPGLARQPARGAAPARHRQTCTLGRLVERVGEEDDLRRRRRATTPRTCSSGSVTGLPVDQQAAGAVAVGGHHQPAVGQPPRRAGHQLHPGLVGVEEGAVRVAARRVDGEHLEPPLVPRLHRDVAGRRPRPSSTSTRYGKRLAVPRRPRPATPSRPRRWRVTTALSVPAAG